MRHPIPSSTALSLLLISAALQSHAQYIRHPRGRALDLARREGPGPTAPGPEAASPRDPPGAETEDAAGASGDKSDSESDDKGDEGPSSDQAKEKGGDEHSSESEQGGSGDQGGGGESKDLYLVSHEDFCVYGPKEANTPIASAGEDVISWCTKEHGGKIIPEGTFEGVTYVKTPNYVQVSGTGDFTKLNIASNDMGGQFDSSEHTPEGAQLFLGENQPAANWVTLIDAHTFCVRACTGDPQYCPTQYDEIGCWIVTNNGIGWPGYFQDCEGEDGEIPGVEHGSTFTPGQGTTPTPVIAAVSNCKAGGGLGGAAATGAGAGAGQHNSSAAHGSAGKDGGGSTGSPGEIGGASTSWLPVETCVPCAGAGAASGDKSSSQSGSGSASKTATAALSGTSEVGVDKLQSGPSGPSPTLTGGAAEALGVSGAAGPTAAPKPAGDALVQKRQEKSDGGEADKPAGGGKGSEGGEKDSEGEKEGGKDESDGGDKGEETKGGGETVTKGDQCCFTTWTQASAAATGSAKSGNGTSLGGAAGAKSTGPSGAVPSASGSKLAPGSGGVNKTANAANGTGNGTGNSSDSGAYMRMESFGVEGMGTIVVGLMVGLIGGGWMLV